MCISLIFSKLWLQTKTYYNKPMHDIKTNFDKVFHTIKSLDLSVFDSSGNLCKPGPRPEFSDLEVIALALTAEYMSCDSENWLFNKVRSDYSDSFPHIIDRSRFNRRKRALFDILDLVRRRLSERFLEFEDYFIIDSMPLEVCKLSREKRSRICSEAYETSPEKGYCASQKMYFYGYKLQGVCSVNGVFHSVELTKANVHDAAFLPDMNSQLTDCVLIGDKGYLSSSIQLDLFHTANIKLETPMRSNQKAYVKQAWLFRKTRKRLETLYSQLCDQFMIRRNYAKTFKGFKTRILAKITALTLVQYINKFDFNRPINNLKVAIT
jgi:hypothetical protein